MSSSIMDIIGHYQRSIERSQNGNDGANSNKLLHGIEKLYKLPVTVDHLQATGIGKTVNSLRKYDGEVGVAAKALVAKWKAMVTAEEFAAESAASTVNKMETDDNDDDNDDEDDDENVHKDNTDAGGGDKQKVIQDDRTEHHSNHNKKNDSNRNHSSSHKEDNTKKSSSSSSSKDRNSRSSSSKSKHEKTDKKNEKLSKNSSHHDHQNGFNSETIISKPLTPKFDENHENQHSDNDDEQTLTKDRDFKISQSQSKKTKHNSSSRDKDNKHHHSLSKSTTKNHSHNQNRSDEKSSSKSSSKTSTKHREEQHPAEKHHSKDKDLHKHHQKSSSSSSCSNNNNSNKIKDSTSKDNKNNSKRRHSITEPNDSKSCEVTSSSSIPSNSNSSSINNKNKIKKIVHEEIDSTTGTSFEDALGMMIPLKLSNANTNKSSSKIKSPTSSKTNHSSSKCSSSSAVASSSSGSSSSHRHNNSSSSSSSKKTTNDSSNSSKKSPKDCDDIAITPQLLSSSVNLKPLDPNIAIDLPTVSISNNYKPMPLNQTVMDCVFRSNQQQKPLKTESETLQLSMSSKTMRTKVYSGVKTGQIHQVPKLFDLCIRFLQKNIDSIEYCGGYPYDVLRHFLERATPIQLMNFEEWNQYIIEDTDELWHQHVLRHYRSQKREEMESWREMFMRCKEAQETRLNMLAENIKQSQKLVALPVKKTQLAFVDSMVKPPRSVQRKQDQFGTTKKLIATPAARVASLCHLTPNATQTGDARLRIMAGERDNAQVSGFSRPKKAPLMAKTLQFMKGRHPFKR